MALLEIFIDKSESTSLLNTVTRSWRQLKDDDFDPSADDDPFDSVYDDLINDNDDVKLFDMVAITDYQVKNGQLQVQIQ